MNARKALALSLPALCGVLALAWIALARDPHRFTVQSPGSSTTWRTRPAAEPEPAVVPAPVERPKPDSDDKVARAVERERIRATVDNYRAALASRNVVLEERLRPVLLRDREVALEFAREQLARASEPLDYQLSSKVISALEK
jgi:hypothetical protein